VGLAADPNARPSLDRCAACGQQTEAPERCPHCGASLLVDVALDPVPTEARQVYVAARAAASAHVPRLDFAAARAALECPGAPLAKALRRDRARALVHAISAAGFSAVARASAPAARRSGIPRAAWLVVAGVGAIAVALAGTVLSRARSEHPAGAAAAASAPGITAERGQRAEPERATAPPALDRDLTVEELARAARPAIAVLQCGAKLGTGFFVGPERLLTNAHVTCGSAATIDVKLPGGRQLLGKVRALEEWLDFAVVDVPGAKIATPLPLGDSSLLVEGNPVVLVGHPLGLDATVHSGKVSFAARNLQGVAYVQLNADVNPGNSGGPVLDGKGRVVGIVTLKAEGATGVGFALPVEYVREAAEQPQPDLAATRRWAATLAAVQQEDDAEAARVIARLDQALLVAAQPVEGRLGVVLMKRFPSGPYPAPVPLEVRDGDRVVCELSAAVQEWRPIEDRLKDAIEGERATRVARWMVRRKISTGVHTGGALVSVEPCPETVGPSSFVAVRGVRDEPAAYPWQELARGRREAQERERAKARIEAASTERSEAEWRSAFAELRERLARLQEKRRALREALDRQIDSISIDRARRELPSVESELERAREALEDLDRRASNQSIPQEWRR
jgi:S1-C subfamily serine protease